MIDVHFDMETSDPDDVMTLAILACHPHARLVGVTATPGGRDQYDLIKHVLGLLDKSYVPVGVFDPDRTKPSVSEFHTWLGTIPPSSEAPRYARHVLNAVIREHPDAIFLTGGPLKNYGAYAGFRFFEVWVGQGGFAGDSVVPPEHRLPKFAGRETCPTFNFNGSVSAAKAIFVDSRIRDRVLVSKNVCHGLAWDREFHDRVGSLAHRTPGLELVYDGMSKYLNKRPEGKLLHDPLAMAVALDRSVCTLRRVAVYREGGEWGSRLPNLDEDDSNAWITTWVDRERFFEVLTAC
jgi:inosine-uridine nucleoside N-ribohydrolase